MTSKRRETPLNNFDQRTGRYQRLLSRRTRRRRRVQMSEWTKRDITLATCMNTREEAREDLQQRARTGSSRVIRRNRPMNSTFRVMKNRQYSRQQTQGDKQGKEKTQARVKRNRIGIEYAVLLMSGTPWRTPPKVADVVSAGLQVSSSPKQKV